MSDLAPSDPVEQGSALLRTRQVIERVTSLFPISQLLVPLTDTLDWLLDDVSTERYWLEELQSRRVKFASRWQQMIERALAQSPREVSDLALKDPKYDPLKGGEPWGAELTLVFRNVLAELEEFGDEAMNVFATDERTRAFARAIRTQTGRLILPVLSYAPLQESEWHAILDRLNELIELTLAFEGAVVVWLIGGFARDVEGRLRLRPQLSFSPPPSGTRIKPVRVLLGTAYEEQCPSLAPIARSVRGMQSRPSDDLLVETAWHRMVVQLDITADDYVLFNLDRLSTAEREVARQVMYLDQHPRGEHVLEGPVHKAPRPWQEPETRTELPQSLTGSSTETTQLPPRPAIREASEPLDVPAVIPDASNLHQDAESLRQKGMAAVETDPLIAQKYLLASTVLENNSVDVWLTLVEIASNDKQRASFRREAEKVLRRMRRTL
jgi:hypothetical protein